MHVIDAVPSEAVVAVVAEGVQLGPADPGTGVNVTVTPLAAVPLDVTVATSILVKASPTFAFCPDPLVAVIAMVGGGVLEPLLQPVKKPKASQTRINARMLVKLRFIASPLSRRRVHGLAATLRSRAHCVECRFCRLL